MQQIVQGVTGAADIAAQGAKAGISLVADFENMGQDMALTTTASQDILSAAIDIGRAVLEAQRGAELVAGASLQQSAAAEEAQKAVQEQARALDQGQTAARGLAKLAHALQAGDKTHAGAQMGTGAEAALRHHSGTFRRSRADHGRGGPD